MKGDSHSPGHAQPRKIGRIWDFFCDPHPPASLVVCSPIPKFGIGFSQGIAHPAFPTQQDVAQTIPTLKATQPMVPGAGVAEKFSRERLQGTFQLLQCHLSSGNVLPSIPLSVPAGRTWQLPFVGSEPASGARCSISALRDKNGVKKIGQISGRYKNSTRGHFRAEDTSSPEPLKKQKHPNSRFSRDFSHTHHLNAAFIASSPEPGIPESLFAS